MFSALRNKEINWWKIIFVVFVAAYVLLMLLKPSFGPDDAYQFFRTIQSGHPFLFYSSTFPYYDYTKMGRFSLMGGMEYNLLTLFSKSPSVFWYYFIHAVQYVLFMFFSVKILNKFTSNKLLIYAPPILISLLPGFINPWFQLLISERNVIFYIAVFIFCYISYLEKLKIHYLILGVLSASVVIYTKENSFIVFAVFAFCHLLFSWKNSIKINAKIKIFDGLILLSSISFPIIYFFHTFLPYKGLLTYGKTAAPFITLIKSILNQTIVLNPIMMLIVLPLMGWRLYKIFLKGKKPHAIYDSLLFGASICVISYFMINISNSPSYFIPMYIFIAPVLFYFVPKIWNENLIWKILALITGFLLLFNTLPLTFHYLTYAKYMPLNFNKTLDFMVNEIKSKPLPTGRQAPNKRVSIFLDGMDRCAEGMTYFTIRNFYSTKV